MPETKRKRQVLANVTAVASNADMTKRTLLAAVAALNARGIKESLRRTIFNDAKLIEKTSEPTNDKPKTANVAATRRSCC